MARKYGKKAAKKVAPQRETPRKKQEAPRINVRVQNTNSRKNRFSGRQEEGGAQRLEVKGVAVIGECAGDPASVATAGAGACEETCRRRRR